MASLTYFEPQRAGSPLLSPDVGAQLPAQGATWLRGNFLIAQSTIGGHAIVVPKPIGSMANVPGPVGFNITLLSHFTTQTVGNVTIAGHNSSGAPAATYYIFMTYDAAGPSESLAGPEFVVNCVAGIVPGVTVASTGAPSAATGTHIYAGIFSGSETQQDFPATNLGSEAVLTSPLLTNYGLAQAPSNTTANIVGMAQNYNNSNYFSGTGGSVGVGLDSLFGATMDIPALTPQEVNLGYYDRLQFQQVEVNLVQPYYPALNGQPVGITLDPTTGFHVADTTATTCATLLRKADGAQITSQGGITGLQSLGNVGDSGARVIIQFLPAALI